MTICLRHCVVHAYSHVCSFIIQVVFLYNRRRHHEVILLLTTTVLSLSSSVVVTGKTYFATPFGWCRLAGRGNIFLTYQTSVRPRRFGIARRHALVSLRHAVPSQRQAAPSLFFL